MTELTELKIEVSLFDLIRNFATERKIPPRLILRYCVYVGAAIQNAREMIGLEEPWPEIVSEKNESPRTGMELRLPFPATGSLLRLQFNRQTEFSAIAIALLGNIEDVFAGIYSETMNLEYDDLAECFLLSFRRTLASQLLVDCFQEACKTQIETALVEEIMLLLESAGRQTYEGNPSELTDPRGSF